MEQCISEFWHTVAHLSPNTSMADALLQVAPAMNTYMWSSPFTSQHIDILQEQLGVDVIYPIAKALACGDVGPGAMAEPHDIAQRVKLCLTPEYTTQRCS